ncbi:MAG: hypothetical protein ACREEB_09300 [Caulobacteraceae bacterium]
MNIPTLDVRYLSTPQIVIAIAVGIGLLLILRVILQRGGPRSRQGGGAGAVWIVVPLLAAVGAGIAWVLINVLRIMTQGYHP